MILKPDEIDFSKYLRETDHQQKVKAAGLWVDELIDRIQHPVKEIRAVMPWRKTHSQMAFRPGEVTIWGGANGQGKSLVTGQVAMSLCAQGEKVCIASFEMKPLKTLERMGRQWSGINPAHAIMNNDRAMIDMVLDVYGQFRDWTTGKLWLYDQQGTVDSAQVCAVVRYCAKEKGITHFFVDSLMKCVADEDDYNGQKRMVDELTAIARDNNIHIHLVHHIKKPANEDHKPTKYDYKGSGAITDQVDNVITVWRNKIKEKAKADGKEVRKEDPDALLICDKQRHGEWEGNIGLWFSPQSMQYVSYADEEPMLLYMHPEH